MSECRIKREEDRLKREIEEREIKEAEELLAKTGKGKKLKEGEKLDKNAIMQVTTLRLFRHPEVHMCVLSIILRLAANVGNPSLVVIGSGKLVDCPLSCSCGVICICKSTPCN